MNAYLGIDPGITGAICLITNKEIRIWDCPNSIIEMDLILKSINRDAKIYAYIEDVHTISKWSRQSGDKLMINLGQWEGLLTANNIKYSLVKPKTWQKYMIKKIYNDTKKNSLYNALNKNIKQETFYGYNKQLELKDIIKGNHNRSDAFLIALFNYRTKGELNNG